MESRTETREIKRKENEAFSSIPGPQYWPPLGRVLTPLLFYKDSIGFAGRLFDEYGSITSLLKGGGTKIHSPRPSCPGTVFVRGSKFVQEVETKHNIYHKYPITLTLYPLGESTPRQEPLKYFGSGLFGLNEDKYHQHRRLIMPAFHKTKVDSYLNTMVQTTQASLDRWLPGQNYKMLEEMQLMTMEMLTKTLFGQDLAEHYLQLGQLIGDSLHLAFSASTVMFPVDLPGFPYHRLLNMAARANEEIRKIINLKRASGAHGEDVLSALIQARDEESKVTISENELIGHIGVLFGAGHETTANSLTWTLFLLSQHPKVASDVLDEIEGALRGGPPTHEHLRQLPLLERVIKESLRILPAVPFTGRVAAQPVELGGYALPTGTEMMVSIYHTHHDPSLYSDPKTFFPQRWENFTPNGFEFNAFGAGPRVCIGAGMAMMEMKVILSMLLQRYRLQCVPNIRVDRSGLVFLTAKQGMPMTVHRQDRQFSSRVDHIRGNIREMVNLQN